ncbi:hypothetical protein [Pedomonas mirosovicensis]|uniref:hypothetical protein n=1 Tax=Pedomonas mirosovicensis TaxID=2908641 RepID=UPI002169CA4D|nr:hypothetical protein [Pedomonas mirosovicensis]MCH8684960.1 hypothetical protein [Pedomonas mirosovicensis]
MKWFGKLALGAACVAFGAGVFLISHERPAEAQSFGVGGGGPLHVAASSVGNTSHAWAIDPRTSLVIHCVAEGVKAEFKCASEPLPGMARP